MFSHNIHNHSTYSDGRHSPRELIEFSQEHGIDLLGISDHFATKKVHSITPESLATYKNEIDKLHKENQDRIRVLAGAELDSNPMRTDFRNLDMKILDQLDFVLFEYVQDPLWGGMSLDEFLSISAKLNVPVGLAHPDIELILSYLESGFVLKKLEEHNIFIELSTAKHNSRMGKQYYHHADGFFRDLKETNIGLALGSDTHENISDITKTGDGKKFIVDLGLENNVKCFFEMIRSDD